MKTENRIKKNQDLTKKTANFPFCNVNYTNCGCFLFKKRKKPINKFIKNLGNKKNRLPLHSPKK